MTAGVEIINETGQFQINSQYYNLELIEKGTLTCTPWSLVSQPTEFPFPAFGPYLTRATITVSNASTVMLAVRNNSGLRITSAMTSSSGSSATYSVYVESPTYLTNQSAEYFLFKVPQPSNSRVGLQVFKDEPGNPLAYCSSKKYMRVLGSVSGRYVPGDQLWGSGYSEPIVTRTHSGKRLAVVCGVNAKGGRLEVEFDSGTRITYFCEDCTVFRFSGDSVSFVYKHYFSRATTAWQSDNRFIQESENYQFLILDVTNY